MLRVVRALGGLGQGIRARPGISYTSNMSKAVITAGTSGKKGGDLRKFSRDLDRRMTRRQGFEERAALDGRDLKKEQLRLETKWGI